MKIVQFFVENINTIISFLALIMSVMSVWYARKGAKFGEKGYQTAEKIFNEGVQLDCNKVFEQLGLELTMNIIIPFLKFENAVSDCLYNKKEDIFKQKVSEVYSTINNNIFEFSCPYWDMYKGDVWDAFEKLRKDEQKGNEKAGKGTFNVTTDAFLKIWDFIEKAKDFEKGIGSVCRAMDRYVKEQTGTEENCLRGKNNVGKKLTMKGFLDAGGNNYLYSEGKNKVKELGEAIESLPEELNIKDKKQRLQAARKRV
ncbi:MAG: hypothetical protein Q4C77_05945 [Eubacteriales bacterium]|nr:hypothetical protein [Eubacteriales bacterium]